MQQDDIMILAGELHKKIHSPNNSDSSVAAGSVAEVMVSVKSLYDVGAACERCGWALDHALWCTENHSIKVKDLLALKVFLKEQ